MKRLLMAVLALAATASHANLADAPTIFESGKWKVVRDIDKMTDKAICVGIHNNNYKIQLNDDSLYLLMPGNLRGVVLRYNEGPPLDVRLPNDSEKNYSGVILKGMEFIALQKTQRLRVRAVLYSDEMPFMDLDVTGVKDVLTYMKQSCAQASDKPAAAGEPTKKVDGCTSEIRARMRITKLSPKQIAAVCD